MQKDILISIVIPTYNEENRILPTLKRIRDYFENKKVEYEIIIVDDGSEDSTVSVIEKHSFRFKYLTLLKNDKNMGKGYSVKRGMLKALGELKLFMDADSSVDITTLDVFIKYVKTGVDIIIGSIELEDSHSSDDNHPYRRIFGKISKFIIQNFATPGIYDTQRGFKLFTKNAADVVFNRLTIDRWGFDIELIVIAQKNGLKIKEVPVNWQNSKASSVHIGSYFTTLYELIRIKINSLKGLY